MIDFHKQLAIIPEVYETAQLQDNLEHSGGISISWKSADDTEIPIGSHITYPVKNEDDDMWKAQEIWRNDRIWNKSQIASIRYILIDPYAPTRQGIYYKYDPQFKHPQALLDRTPFWIRSMDAESKPINLRTTSYTGMPWTIAKKLVDFLAEYANETDDTFFAETVGLIKEDGVWYSPWEVNIPEPAYGVDTAAIISVPFDGCSIKGAADAIANAMGCNVYWDWSTKTVRFIAGTTIQGETYNCFHVLGGTTNMGKVSPSGSYAAVTQRLALKDPVEGEDTFIINEGTANEKTCKILKGSIISMAGDGMRLTEDLILDDIYPKMELYIKTARERVCRMTDENGNFIVDHFEKDGHVVPMGTEGAVEVLKKFSKWYVTFSVRKEGSDPSQWEDYEFDQGNLIDDKPLAMLFQIDYKNPENMSSLVGRQYELTYYPKIEGGYDLYDKNDDVATAGSPFHLEGGEFYIAFEAVGERILPTTSKESVDMYPVVGKKVTLVNVALTQEKSRAQDELLAAAKEVIALMQTPSGQYSETVVFAEAKNGEQPKDTIAPVMIGGESPFDTRKHGPVVTGLSLNLDTNIAEVTVGSWTRKTKTGGMSDKVDAVTITVNSSTVGGDPYSDGSIGEGGGYTPQSSGNGSTETSTMNQTQPKPDTLFVASLGNTIDVVSCLENGKVKQDTDIYTKINCYYGTADITEVCNIRLSSALPSGITAFLETSSSAVSDNRIRTDQAEAMSQNHYWLRIHVAKNTDLSSGKFEVSLIANHPYHGDRGLAMVVNAMIPGASSVRIDLDNDADYVSLDSMGKVRFARTITVNACIYDGSKKATTGVAKHSTLTAELLKIGNVTPQVSEVVNGVVTITWNFAAGDAVAATHKTIELDYTKNGETLTYETLTYSAVFSFGALNTDAVYQLSPSLTAIAFERKDDNTLDESAKELGLKLVKFDGTSTTDLNKCPSGYSVKYVFNNSVDSINDGTAWPIDSSNGDVFKKLSVANSNLSVSIALFYTANNTSVMIDRESIPVIKDGLHGDGIKTITRTYARSAQSTTTNDSTAPAIDGSWSASSPEVTEAYPYLWVKEVVAYKYKSTADTRYYYIGKRGDNGVDAQDIEFVYVRTTENVAPTVVACSNNDYKSDDYLPYAKVTSGRIKGGAGGNTEGNTNDEVRCTDDPQGVNETWKYEWEIKREKGAAVNGHREWVDYSGTMTLHNNFAESAFIIDIDNDNDQFGTDSESSVLTQQKRRTNVYLYYGTEKQTLNADNASPKGVTAVLKYSDDDSAVPSSVAEVSCIRDTNDSTKGLVEVTIKQGTFAKEGMYALITANCARGGKTARFTLEKVKSGKKGENPVIYQLKLSQNSFSYGRDASNNLVANSNSVTVKLKVTEGNDSTLYDSSNIAQLSDAPKFSWGYDSTETAQASEQTIGTTVTIAAASVGTHKKVWFLLTTGDKEEVPIVKDGTHGDNAVRIDLDNENDSMLYTSGGTLVSGNVTSKASLYDGSEEKSSSTTWLVTAEGCTLSSNSNNNNIVVSGMTAETGKVTVKGTYTDAHGNNHEKIAVLTLKKLVDVDKYDLVIEPNAVAYNATTDSPDISTINISVYKMTVNGERTLSTPPSEYKVYAGASEATATSTEGKYTATTDNSEISELLVKIAKSASSTDILDAETIPINKAYNGANAEIPAYLFIWKADSVTSVTAPTVTAANYMSGTNLGGWSKQAPNQTAQGKHLWLSQNTVVKSVDGTYSFVYNTWSTPIRISGDKGEAGVDSSDREFIYKRLTVYPFPTTETRPASIKKDINGTTRTDEYIATTDNFVPQGWSNNALPATENEKYVYCAIRVKSAGNNQQWADFGEPFLWSNWGVQGTDGDGVQYLYKLFESELTPAECDLEANKPFQPTFNDTTKEWECRGWDDDPKAPTARKPYCYCSVIRKLNGSWGSFGTLGLWSRYSKDGQNVIRLDIDNESDMVQTDSTGKIMSARTIQTIVHLYDGSSEVDISSATITTANGPVVTGDNKIATFSDDSEGNNKKGKKLSWAFIAGKTMANSYEIEISYTYKSVTYKAVLSIVASKGNAILQLKPSHSALICSRGNDNTIGNPPALSLKIVKIDGSSTQEYDATESNLTSLGVFVMYAFYEVTAYNVGVNWPATNSVQAKTTNNLVSIALFNSSNVLLDKETIPVVKDGTNGSSIKKKSEENKYAVNDSGETAPTENGDDSQTAVANKWYSTRSKVTALWTANKWLWVKTIITWSDDSTTTLYTNERNPNDGIAGQDIIVDGATEMKYAVTDTNETRPTTTAKWDWRNAVPSTITNQTQEGAGVSGTIASDVTEFSLTYLGQTSATYVKIQYNSNGYAQMNTGTVLRIPVVKAGDTISVSSYHGQSNFTLGGENAQSYDNFSHVATAAEAAQGYVEMVCLENKTSYIYSITASIDTSSSPIFDWKDYDDIASDILPGTWLWCKATTYYRKASSTPGSHDAGSSVNYNVSYNGDVGKDGKDGRALTSSSEHYKASSNATGESKPIADGQNNATLEWTDNPNTAIANWGENAKYLWNYEKITYSSGTTPVRTTPRVIAIWTKDGVNGRGIDSIVNMYCITNSVTAPSKSDTTVGWDDNPIAPTADKPYLWNYEYIVWTNGTDTSDKAVVHLIGHFGADGGRIAFIYRWVAAGSTPDKPTIDIDDYDGDNTSWKKSAPNRPDNGTNHLWMSQNLITKAANGLETLDRTKWSTPVRISGDNGSAGEDGSDMEYIYILRTSKTTFTDDGDENKKPSAITKGQISPSGAANNSTNYDNTKDDFVPYRWYDHPQGVDKTNKYEYMSFRRKEKGSSTWGAFSDPIVWSHFGTNGMDGDGVEYVFVRTKGNTPPTFNSYKDSTNKKDSYGKAVADDEQLPLVKLSSGNAGDIIGNTHYNSSGYKGLVAECTDDPQGVTSTYMYEWVLKRTKGSPDADTGTRVWNEYSGTMSLWAKFGKDGDVWTIGTDGYWYKNGSKYTDTNHPNGIKAEGKDGTGVALKGNVDVVFANQAESGQTSLQGLSNVSIGDCYVVNANRHLYFYNGTSTNVSGVPNYWNDMGEFKGEAGTSNFMHVAYANSITLSDGNVTAQTGFSVVKSKDSYPWVGLCVDENETDPGANASSEQEKLAAAKLYKWNYVRGNDGTSPYVADLDNEMDSVACLVNGKPSSAASVSTNVYLYYGSSKIKFKVTSIKRNSLDVGTYGTGVSVKVGSTTIANASSFNSLTAADSAKIEVSYGTNAYISGKDVYTIVLQKDGDTSVERTLTLTINGVRPGQDGADGTSVKYAKSFKTYPSNPNYGDIVLLEYDSRLDDMIDVYEGSTDGWQAYYIPVGSLYICENNEHIYEATASGWVDRGKFTGDDAVIYSLVPSVSQIVKKKDGTYEPTSTSKITCAVKKRVGNNDLEDVSSGYTLKYIKDNGSETPYPSSGIRVDTITSKIVFILYNSAGNKVWDRETVPVVADGKDGTSVLAQYSVDGSTNWHNTFAAGDMYMRTSTDGGTTWSTAMKIVGEDGDPGKDGDYTIFSFNISELETGVDGNTAYPTHLGYQTWQDAPPATTSTMKYLWCKEVRHTFVNGVDTAGTAYYFRLTGEEGQDGTSPYVADLDNEMDSVACNANGQTSSAQSVSTNISLNHGSSLVGFTTAVYDTEPNGYAYESGEKVNGITVSWNNVSTERTNDTVKVAFDNETSVSKKVFCIQISNEASREERELYFTVNGIKSGASPTIYNLKPSQSQINVGRTDIGGYSPSTVSLTCKYTQRTGDSPIQEKSINGQIDSTYNVYFRKRQRSNGAWQTAYYRYNYYLNWQDKTYSLTGFNVATFDAVEFIICTATADTFSESAISSYTVIDRETVPIVSNGMKGRAGDDGCYYLDEFGRASSRELDNSGYPSGLDDELGPDHEGNNNGWQLTAPEATTTYPYIWKRSRLWDPNEEDWAEDSEWSYTCQTGKDGKDGKDGQDGKDGANAPYEVRDYALGESYTSHSDIQDSAWQPTAPTRTAGHFVWMRVRSYSGTGILQGTTYVCLTGDAGQPGGAGKAGRWYDYAGVWGTDTSSVTNTANVGYYVLYYYSDNNKHFYMNTKGDGVANTTTPANSSGTANEGWEQIQDDREYYIVKAIFGDYAEFGSFIINGDWMISRYGIYKQNSSSEVEINNGNYSSYTTAYTNFKPADPMASGSEGYPCFAPNFAVDGKTGETYQMKAHVRGEIEAQSGHIGGFKIGQNTITDDNTTPTFSLDSTNKKMIVGDVEVCSQHNYLSGGEADYQWSGVAAVTGYNNSVAIGMRHFTQSGANGGHLRLNSSNGGVFDLLTGGNTQQSLLRMGGKGISNIRITADGGKNNDYNDSDLAYIQVATTDRGANNKSTTIKPTGITTPAVKSSDFRLDASKVVSLQAGTTHIISEQKQMIIVYSVGDTNLYLDFTPKDGSLLFIRRTSNSGATTVYKKVNGVYELASVLSGGGSIIMVYVNGGWQ